MNTSKPEFVRAFVGLTKNDAHLAGGKGASLGEMLQVGIPVPPGFVVLSESFEYFIHETDLVQEIDSILSKVNHKEIHTVEKASESIKELILSREMPADVAAEILAHFKELGTEYVAVRSSATAEDGKEHAWAGQLESYLNVKEAGVLEKVRHCWASLFTPRAIFYRFEKGLHSTKISVAVVVQKMVNSERSGIAFSVHPVTEDYNQLIIEAGFGLGEAIVSGSVTPDSYVVGKEPRTILDINVSTQERALYRVAAGGNEWRTIAEPQASSQVLTTEEILTLSEIIVRIEKHYGFPCDIEWAYEAGQFYIVQSRPITTLVSRKDVKDKSAVNVQAEDYYLNFKAKVPGLYFVELGTIAYDPDGVINIVKDGMVYSFYTREIERNHSEFAKRADFFETVLSAKRELEDLNVRYAEVELPHELIGEVQFSQIHTDLLKCCSLYRYVNNSYLDTFLIVGTKSQTDQIAIVKNEMQKCLYGLLFSESCIYKKVINNFAHNLKISHEEVGYYYYSELLSLMHNGERLDDGVIQQRKKCAAITKVANGILEFITTNTATELFEALYSQDSNSSTLKGVKAFSNGQVVRGEVKLIHTDYKNPERMKKEMAEMKKSQILVSQITAPELMPAIQKAAAIVTDIGGLLSHAAIISRELKIPCVVGTKNASEVLKDGDMVEVDAEKGVVRKIL